MNCGLMFNYECTAACKHCLYASTPRWNDGGETARYMAPDTLREACATLRRHGCRSVHIGGGEPFMDFDALCVLAQVLRECGIAVEYAETNAFWVADEHGGEAEALRKLAALARVGIDALCISHDAFHGAFIDPALPPRLAALCRRTGFGHFMWQTDINRIRFGGRAVTLENAHRPKRPLPDILREAAAKKSCHSLTSTGHFHVDLHGKYLPPGCTGFVLPLEEVLGGIPLEETRYPAFTASRSGGPAALYALAQKKGFAADEAGYPSVCNFCFYLRKFLSEQPDAATEFPELDARHYKHALR